MFKRITAFIVSLTLFISPFALSLEVFRDKGRIEVEGEISKELGKYKVLQGAIEYLACAQGGKSYESILVLRCKPSEIYNALLSLGLKPGSPASVDESGKRIPPKGPGVTLMVEWKGKDGKTVRVRAEDLVYNSKAERPMRRIEWIFTGSRIFEDPETEKEMLLADMTNNIISTHQADPSVILQNPLPEATDESIYRANERILPKPGSKVKLIIDASRPVGYRLLISGRVQGVGFRAFTKEQAEKLGVVGYVKNLRDGRVEAFLEGRESLLEEMVSRLKVGPIPAKVKEVKVERVKSTGRYKEFKILF